MTQDPDISPNIFLSLSVWLLILVPPSVFPQTSQKPLTLDQAIAIAVDRNRELEIARIDVDKSGQQVRQAWGNAMPVLNFDARYTRALKKPVFFLPDFDDPSSGVVTPIEIGSDHSIEYGFTATQILFNSAVFIGVGTAAIYEKASHEQYRAALNRTITRTKRAFYTALLARHVLDMTLASQTNAENNLKDVRVLNREGIVSDYDLLRAEVQVENIRPMVIEAEKNVLVALNGLKIAMGLDAGEPLSVEGALEFVPVDSSLLGDAARVNDNALVKALGHRKDVSDKVIRLMRSEYLPTLSAFGTYQWQAQKNSLGFGKSDFVGTSQIGLTLSLNLFNGFQTTARVGQAISDLRRADEEILQLKETLKTELQSVGLRLQEAERRIRSQEKTVELAERTYKIATTRYATGSGTQLEINDADVALLRARLNRVQAVYDYRIAAADLEEILSLHQPHEVVK